MICNVDYIYLDSIKRNNALKYLIRITLQNFTDLQIMYIYNSIKKKKEEIWLSFMTKAPTATETSKKQRDNTKTPPKTSITQRLRTDLGRSVGVTTAT